MRTQVRALLVAVVVSGAVGLAVPAESAGSGAVGGDRSIARLTIAADCGAGPGRLAVQQQRGRTGPVTVVTRGTGLPAGLDRGEVLRYDADGRTTTTDAFELDGTSSTVRRRTELPGAPLGRTAGASVADLEHPRRLCSVTGTVDRTTALVRSGDSFLDVRRGDGGIWLNVGPLRCRGHEQVRGRAVVVTAARTTRVQLRSTCLGGLASFERVVDGTALPRSVRVVGRSSRTTWHASYAITRR